MFQSNPNRDCSLLRVGITRIFSQFPVSDLGEWCHICHFFRWQKKVMRRICHISGKNVTLSHAKILFLPCDVFCHILPENCHILASPVQNFFEREEMWRFDWDWNVLFSPRLIFVTYLEAWSGKAIWAKTDPQSHPNPHISSRSKKNCTGGAKMWRFSGRMWQKMSQVKVGLGISRTNAVSQWNPVYNPFHRFFCCGNETTRR